MKGDGSRTAFVRGFRAQNGDRRGGKARAAASVAGLSRAAQEAACVGAGPLLSLFRIHSTSGPFCFGRAVPPGACVRHLRVFNARYYL
jgi:hypothetical protein